MYLILSIKEDDLTTASDDKTVEDGKMWMGIIYQNVPIYGKLITPPSTGNFGPF